MSGPASEEQGGGSAPDGIDELDGAGDPDGAGELDGAGGPDDEAAASQVDEPGDPRGDLASGDQRYIRLAADFENFRRRKNRELIDRSRYASEDAARALLPVLDNLRRAVGHAVEAPGEELISGLELVVREFENALEKLGVTPIEALGQPFDPALHEAIGGEESDSVDVDTVTTELQRGYRLHDRMLRPALVRIAHPVPEAEPG